ncbi:MAG: sigma 54-interacting transcriptional regulator [Candidatus Edwardsbacteria bacterium]|jgi:Nif-specific regulatory protein|nr:sigma 54-interacting transcriptional regulator [Candidatus Edwardsbacteria bacterium]
MNGNQLTSTDRDNILALYQISQVINSILDPEELFERMMDLAISALRAERGVVWLKDGGAGELSVRVARNIDRQAIDDTSGISRTVLDTVLQSGEVLLTSDAKSDPRLSGAESVVLSDIRSVLCAPLANKREVIGLIYVDSRTSANVFSDKDREFLAAFANMAAIAIENATLQARLREENISLRQEIRGHYQFENLVGRAPSFLAAMDLVHKVLDSAVPVLIQGESGTGKEMVARAIHYNGPRRDRRFLAQYCGALPETLLESELFGYKRGAFTGANADKKGLFEAAHGGTFFLDEISDIAPSTQAKLLRVLQDGEVRRVGDNESSRVDVRIISATNSDLLRDVKEGRFREDLYYRLNVVSITLPPLRERREDIPLLCRHFLENDPAVRTKGILQIEKKALDLLMDFPWPGNIRELQNAISYMAVMAKGDTIRPADLPENIRSVKPGPPSFTPGRSMREVEKEYLLATLKECGGDRKLTAQKLGISLRTLQYKLKEYRNNV